MKKNPNWFVLIGLSLAGLCSLCCIAVGTVVLFFPSIYQTSLENSSLAVGESAPDFELTALTGETVRLSQFLGQPVLLSFNAS